MQLVSITEGITEGITVDLISAVAATAEAAATIKRESRGVKSQVIPFRIIEDSQWSTAPAQSGILYNYELQKHLRTISALPDRV